MQKYSTEEIRRMILGIDALVKLDDGSKSRAIYFDNASTTPAFKQVAEEVHRQLMYYGSIGRGLGQKSARSSRLYEEGRKTVMDFFGADSKKHAFFYAACTTDGMNKLASALIESPKDMVLATRMEHHANDLPWRERAHTVYIDTGEDGRLRAEDYDSILRAYEGKIKLVTLTAASNVTGYINDVHKIAEIVHRHNGHIVVDGAQIGAHRAFSMKGSAPQYDIDYLVFSAHKMYSPYGGGGVIGLAGKLNERLPLYYGGGMVEAVTDYSVKYSPLPNSYEAGSPNYPGVVGMLKAMEILKAIGFDYIEKHEKMLFKKAVEGLREIPGVILYGDYEKEQDRLGLLVFNLKGMESGEAAKKLAGCKGISVRDGKFCAHTYVHRLMKGQDFERDESCPDGGMIRVSFGIYNTEEEVDALISAVKLLLKDNSTKAFLPNMYTQAFTLSPLPNDRA